jgi:hypothetical protein
VINIPSVERSHAKVLLSCEKGTAPGRCFHSQARRLTLHRNRLSREYSFVEDTAASAMLPCQVTHRTLAAPPFFNKPFSRC